MKKIIFISLTLLLIGFTDNIAQIRGRIQPDSKSFRTVEIDKYDKIIWETGNYIKEPGQPELPVSIKSYLVPLDAEKINISLKNVVKTKISGTFNIYPAQPPVLTGNTDLISFVEPDKSIYNSEVPFPGKTVEIIADEYYLGYRIITICSYPFEYLPKTKEIFMCSFDFTVDYSLSKTVNENHITQNQSLYRYELNKKAVKFRVENPEDVDRYDTKIKNIVQGKTIISSSSNSGLRSSVLSILDEQMPDYIIITADSLKSTFQILADWKTKKGIFTTIPVEKIDQNYQGSDLPEKYETILLMQK